MATVLKFGPADHGRAMDLDEFLAGDYQDGYQYELIDGKVYVSPLPNLPEDFVEQWLCDKLKAYVRRHPQVINHVTTKARVYVPGRRRVTNPEPDICAYKDFPRHRALRLLRWQDVSPLLVVEVLSVEDPYKDLVRNVELYFQVPSIQEYWLLDTREAPERPTMTVYRRQGKKWKIIKVRPGEMYTTKLLPGFKLVLDPRN
jgi:Uma2 family endonuclease